MVFNNNLLLGASTGGYEIEQSIRFNSNDTPIMSRTFGTPTDQNKFTYAFWIKSTRQKNGYNFETNTTGGVTFSGMQFNGGVMAFYDYTGGSANIDVRTTFTSPVGKFRDYTAWFHVMFVYDSDESTASDRLKFFVNGRQFPVADLVGPGGGSVVWPGSGANSKFNASGTVHRISSSVNGLVDGYMAEIHFIDGQALDPTSFGEFNSTSGQFVPIQYTGTFGNNGFLIQGEDSSDLGNDSSGNNNDFTTSGLAAADQISDSPTSNFCIMNSLNKDTDVTLSDGNLQVGWTSGTDPIVCGTMGVSSGKWYYEASFTGTFNFPAVGFAPTELSFGGSAFSSGTGTIFYYAPTGNQRGDGDNNAYGATFSVSDIIGVALNLDDNELTFYKNNASQGTLNLSTLRSGYSEWTPLATGGGSTENIIMNFGQSAFTYTPPTGFNAWSTVNLSNPSISDPSAYFQPTTYTGTNTPIGSGGTEVNQSGNSTFQPDFVWIKSRSNTRDHNLYDAVRGATKRMYSNATTAEETQSEGLASFDADGFTTGNTVASGAAENYVAWQWKANGSGSSNTDGSITSTVSADTTSGFSVATYTGNGTSGATFGHGLGVAPKMVIVKERSPGGNNWMVGHDSVGWTKYLALDTTALPVTSSTRWNDTAPSSTVVTLGNDGGINANTATYVAYCFAEVEGYSKILSYTGNGSTDGPFVFTGFKPAWVMLKRTSGSTQEWQLYDNERDPYNTVNHRLQANSSSAESILTTDNNLDFLSNGFKLRQGNGGMNASGSSYLYMAFAESPFKTATAFGIES